MKFLRSLFSEDSGVSMMRVLSLLSLMIGGYLAITGKDTLVTVFVSAAFLGKTSQKYLELSKKP